MAKKNKKSGGSVTGKAFWFLLCVFSPLIVLSVINWRTQERAWEEVFNHGIKASGIALIIILLCLAGEKAGSKRSAPKNTKKGSSASSGTNPGTYVLRDPATGAETLYLKDVLTGEWISEDGATVLDPDRINEWQLGRNADRAWTDRQNEKLQNGDNAFDRKLQKERDAQKAEEARLDEETRKKLKNLKKYGTLDTDEEHIRKIIERDQRLGEIEADRYRRIGNTWDWMTKGAEVAQKAADYGVEILGEMTGPVGKYGIKNVYKTARNFTARLTDAYVNGKDMPSAVRHATADSIVDVTQGSVDRFGYKFAANTVGDAAKNVMEAIDKGENIVEAAATGALQGTFKTGVESVLSWGGNSYKASAVRDGMRQMNQLNRDMMQNGMSKAVYEGKKLVIQRGTESAGRVAGLVTDGLMAPADDLTASMTDAMFNTHSKTRW